MTRIPVVNEQDEIIGYKDRKDILPSDIIRVAGAWIINEFGELLLARRALDKKSDPGLWSVSVAGTVEEGETYESNVVKEIGEEVDIFDVNPQYAFSAMHSGKDFKIMTKSFILEIKKDTSINPNPMEVMEVRWFSLDEVEKLLSAKPEMFASNFPFFYKKFSEYYETQS